MQTYTMPKSSICDKSDCPVTYGIYTFSSFSYFVSIYFPYNVSAGTVLRTEMPLILYFHSSLIHGTAVDSMHIIQIL